MPASRFSRHEFCPGYKNTAGYIGLYDRVPYRFVDLVDNRTHLVKEGDSLWTLAGKYFASLGKDERPASSLWWVIADFQDPPIIDPTVRLSPGTTIVIPSEKTVSTRIFDPRRRVGQVLEPGSSTPS